MSILVDVNVAPKNSHLLHEQPPTNDGHGHHSCDAPAPCRPNSLLSIEERLDKKQLKKQLKLETRLRKLTVRKHQAMERGDDILLFETQDALEQLFLKQPQLQSTPVAWSQSTKRKESSTQLYLGHADAQSLVHSIHLQLGRALRQNESIPIDYHALSSSLSSKERKEYYTQQVRPLMKSMMKGTQTEQHFDNPHALYAYTSHKFYERSMLVIDSLGKLFGRSSSKTYLHYVECLTQVSCICSIGCGPGCDAFSAAVLLATLPTAATSKKCDIVAILLDWTIDQWREQILSTLETLVVPKHIQTFCTGRCDVRSGLTEHVNVEARDLLFANGCVGTCDSSATTPTLYIVSYLLSETREKWQTFFDDLMKQSPSETLFLLMDPTSWQLYLWLERYRNQVEHVWLDSSMDRPDLQALMRRFGPAVVLAVKR
ncbi:hypothetical protein MPSEU_000609000 [Mayamaea pseudoterrestris]|nr:hypothetical protein MPSEU_000609000 [Mayamaea pseudoterrestris]